MSSNNSCESCGAVDGFRWTGRHMVCKCGTVLIREVLTAQQIREDEANQEKIIRKKKQEEEKRIRRARSLSGHYEKMKNFDRYLDESTITFQ